MGAGSLLALVARHSLLPVRHNSKLAAQDNIDVERPAHHVTQAQLAEEQPADADAGVQLFSSLHLDLAERLQQLQLLGAGNAHLNWLLDALASTLSTHSSLRSALTTAPALVPKHRADEVLSMLDVCTALKQVADDMERHLGYLQQALQSVAHALASEKPLASGMRLRAAAHRLSACLPQQDPPHTNNILCVLTGKRLYRPLAEARSSLLLAAKRELQGVATSDPAATLLSQAFDGAMLTSLLVLAAAVSSLAPPSPRKSSGTITGACKMIIKYLGAKSVSAPWAAPLRQLHRDLRQEDRSAAGGALFQELQGLHAAATKLHEAICTPAALHSMQPAVVKQSVESLRKSLREVQSCITMFRTQMASFFQALVTLRLALLPDQIS